MNAITPIILPERAGRAEPGGEVPRREHCQTLPVRGVHDRGRERMLAEPLDRGGEALQRLRAERARENASAAASV